MGGQLPIDYYFLKIGPPKEINHSAHGDPKICKRTSRKSFGG